MALRRPQPPMNARTSANAVKSRSGSTVGTQPSSSRMPPTSPAAFDSSADTVRGAPYPSPRATVVFGERRSRSDRSATLVAQHRDCRHGRGAADVVREPDLRVRQLVGGLAAQLLHDLVALCDAGGARRVALGLQAAAGVHRAGAGELGRAGGYVVRGAEAVAEPEV